MLSRASVTVLSAALASTVLLAHGHVTRSQALAPRLKTLSTATPPSYEVAHGLSAAGQDQPLKTIREGVLDRIELFVEWPPRASETVVTIRPFATEAANLGTGATGAKDEQKAAQALRTDAPKQLEAAFMKALSSGGGFKGVVRDGTGDLVVEGSFTDINPGSLPKKGDVLGERSVVAIAGTVKDASGKLLARFEQRRVATTRVLGADPASKMRQDSRNLGEDIAKFLKAWTSGKSLS